MLGRIRRHLQGWQHVTYGDIRVHWRWSLQGGGQRFGQRYVPFLTRRRMPRQESVFEWCAGPGFIGFSLLAHGLCDRLCLADVSPKAVEACRRTVRENRLEDRVRIHLSDNLRAIPEGERFGLVVGNPPHFHDQHVGNLRAHDPDWRIHRELFAGIRRHLTEDGAILLQENVLGSRAETFREMIESNGLSIVYTSESETLPARGKHIYFLGVARAGRASPRWLTGGTSQN